MTFAGKVKEQIAPSTDRAAVLAAVEGAKLTRGTSVYDAIDAASELVGTDGARSLLVLSDGADTNSSTTLEVVSNDATNAGVVVDVVALQGSGRAAAGQHPRRQDRRPGHPRRP